MAYRIKNCEDADRLIQKALDGTLNPAEREALDRHMAGCTACAAAWDKHRELARLATAWARRPAASVPDSHDFTAAVLAQIAVRPQASPETAASPWALRLGAAFFAVLIVVASYFLSSRITPVWAPPQMPALSPDTPSTVWMGIWQTIRSLPSDATSAWNGLISEPISYYPALAALGLALGLALVLKLQAQRPRGRAQ